MITTKIDKSKVDNITFDGIDRNDHPDYCDVYILSADYDGKAMDSDDIDSLNEDRDFVHEKLWDYLF